MTKRSFLQSVFGVFGLLGGLGRADGAPLSAAEPAPPRDVSDAELVAWLSSKGAREWHLCAQGWNWDRGLGPLPWIIRQPDCDRGTAIMVFALAQPDYFSKYSSVEEMRSKEGFYRDIGELALEICRRWAGGQYRLYRFEPSDLPRGVGVDNLPWPVPADLAKSEKRGERIGALDWQEGVPIELIYG